ncbi:hypothetical protein HDU99_008902 [Rhizoclosmatium hyalinum]|nr:hypothetical protein HDU99_008902 [Rhizoclosmatium hyalinum]
MYPPTPAAAVNAYGYPTQAAPVAAFNNINNRPQPNAINQPPQQQFNQYGAPMVIGYNNNPQISTQPQRAQIYPPAAPQPSPAQFNPQYRQPFNPQQQQQQYPQPQQLQLPPPSASNLQGLLNQTRMPAPTNHDQDSPLNSEDLTYTDPSTSSPPKSLNPLTAALGSMNPPNSARTLASSNASRAILPPPPQHSPSPMLIAQSQQQQEQQFQERRPRAAHPFASTEPSKRPPRGASAAKPIEPEISSQFAPTVATEEEDDDHDFLESYLDRPADDDDDNDDAQYAPEEEEEEYASSLASSSDDSLLRAPQPVNLLVGRDHTVRRGVDPRTVGLGAPVRRLSGDERKKQFEELHLMNQKRLSREVVGGGGVGGGMEEFVKSGGVLFPRTSVENGRPRGRDLNEDEDEGGRRPRRTSAGREDGGGRGARVSGDTRNQYDLDQQDQEARPRARTSAPRNDVQQQGFTPRARSSSGARNTEPQSQLSPSTDGYNPRPRQQSSEATTPQQQGQPMRRARSSDNQTTNSTTPDNASRQPPTRPSNEPATRKRFSKDFASADLGDGFALRSITAAKRASRELTQPVALARERAAKRASLTFDAGSSSGSDNSRRGSKERWGEDGRSAVASKLTEEYASTRWDDLDRGRSGKEGAEGAVGKLEVVEKVVVEDPYHGYGSARAYYKAKYLNNAGGGAAAGTSAVTSPVVQEEPVPSVTATSRGAARSRSQARPV